MSSLSHIIHSLRINSEASGQLHDKGIHFMNVKQCAIPRCLEIMKFCRTFLQLQNISISAVEIFMESFANFQNSHTAGHLFVAVVAMFGWWHLQHLHCMRPYWEMYVSVIAQQVK